MIDETVLDNLAAIDGELAHLRAGEYALLHSTKFVLELPATLLPPKYAWPGKPLTHLVNWRDLIPARQYVKAVAMRETAPNGVSCMQIMSLSTDDNRLMQQAYYDLCRDYVDELSFHIMLYPTPPDYLSGVAVFSGDRQVGAVGAYLGRLPPPTA